MKIPDFFYFISPMLEGGTGTQRPHIPISILRQKTQQLVFEVCHFTQDLNPLWPTRTLIQRLKSKSRPILNRIHNLPQQQIQFQELVNYFFVELGFQLRPQSLSLQSCFLPQVLNSREGPVPLLMLLFCSLAEEADIKVQLSSSRKRHLLKVQLDGRSHIVDFDNKCRCLEPFEIVELINQGFDFSSGAINMDMLVIDYLIEIRKLARQEKRLQILSLVHSYLMRYQPFNLKHLSERAVVAYETGDYKTAIDDIRSYFLYKQPEFNNLDLKRIYKLCLKRVRHPEN